MQYYASLITADGAYPCPVGSIMAIFMTKVRGKVINVKFIMVEDLIWGIDILFISVKF